MIVFLFTIAVKLALDTLKVRMPDTVIKRFLRDCLARPGADCRRSGSEPYADRESDIRGIYHGRHGAYGDAWL